MRTKLLFKSLLVAAGLCAGQSAWAEDVYTEVYQKTSEAGTNQWSADDVTAWGSIDGLGIQAETNYFGFAGTTANSASYTISAIENNAKVKYEVEWYVKSTNGGYGSMYSYLKLGNLYIRVTDNWKNNDIGFSTDGGSTYCTDFQSSKTSQWVRSGNIVTVAAILNTANDVVESMSVVIDGTTYTATNLTTTSLSGSNDKIIGLGASSTRSGKSTSLIKSITVSQCPQAVTEATYTINYQLNGTTVKTVAGTSVVGAEITALTVIDGTEEGYVGNHYLITAEEAPTMTLVASAASNILNVPVRAPYTATLTVTKTIGGEAQTPEVNNLTETDAKVCSWVYTYPMYIQKDGVYYIADETTTFGESGTFTDGQSITKTVSYTNPDYSVVYFGEPNESAGTNTAYSNGATGHVTGGVTFDSDKVIRLGQLTAGTYRLITNVTGDAGRNLVVGDYTSGTSSFPTALVTISSTGAKDETFTVDGTQYICISGKAQSETKFNQSATVDYILVKAVSLSGTIASSGYSSLASAYGLDFSSATGIEAAYVVKSTTTEAVTLEAVDELPANSGVILKGTAGAAYSIPVKADATFAGTNLLKAAVTATSIAANEAYILQGGKFHLVDAASTVPAGKAYLLATDVPSSARSLNFVFDEGETTGINEELRMKNEESSAAPVYNLNGQRVAQPTRGLYIVNGKKVVVK